jgi:hypothetical protein
MESKNVSRKEFISIDFSGNMNLASRRHFLATLAGASTLAGCSALPSGRASLDLAIFSHLDEPYEVRLRLFRGDKQARYEAKVYDKTLSIEAEGEVQRDDFVPARQYEVRFTVFTSEGRTTQKDHVHYYPVQGKEDLYIAFDLDPGGVMRMR